ncbi:MAG: ribonuclease Z [Bacteroidaceae bacterium]|jgi:ribonuclease Z|nr:ribonuclease Z [Bacteroidaceae bacterium]MBR6169440.1 ribonuclease Z [Bacteroidaceae bacterium]
MEIFEVNILGCGSAKPTLRHLPTSQIVNIRGKYYMIDCGEGAQIQMQKMGLPMARVGHIFISHNHGDHVFGLPGLISTMALLGRTAELHIHGPQQLQEFLDNIIRIYCEGITFQIIFHPIDTRVHNIIYKDRSVTVWSIPLQHRIPCSGFLFQETPPLPHIRREMIDAFNIPFSQINNIKAGADWTTEDGTFIPNERLVTPAAKARSYAYCSDTAFLPKLAEQLQGVTLLYHEATYPEELLKRAQETLHSTASQAATIAKEAHAEKLCIGHFSARIKDEDALLAEATAIFPQTSLAFEGLNLKI